MVFSLVDPNPALGTYLATRLFGLMFDKHPNKDASRLPPLHRISATRDYASRFLVRFRHWR
jgi:hypothetical protein